jgi:23S rRNA (cytosine1962-C5)-methyltransferase
LNLPLIFEDDDLLVINKPAGLLTHPDDPDDPPGADIFSRLKAELSRPYLGLHHRLDREVSGVLLFTLRREANPTVARAFEGREADKEYLAVVRGKPPRPEGTISEPLAGKSGKTQEALTRYKLLSTSVDGRFSLLRLKLETGRTHQLRAHLAQAGCPIEGDPQYGPSDSTIFPRLLLHASHLALAHPATGQPVSFEAPTPPVFEEVMQGKLYPFFETLAKQGLSALRQEQSQALKALLRVAAARREVLAQDPDNTIYRLVNGNGDGLPGFTLDRFGEALVLSLYEEKITAGHPALKVLLEASAEVWSGYPVYVKFRPASAAQLGENAPPEISPPEPLLGSSPDEFTARENGLNYQIRPGRGLSVGLFPDMRLSRARVRQWARGKTVLNCFSYTCGFGLAALSGGATRVLNLDSSRAMLDWGMQNYRENGFEPDAYDFVSGDVFDWLGRFARKGQHFDLVILDPPSYSTTRHTRFSADRNYHMLVELAARVVSPGGTLLACTNHAGLERRAFRQQVQKGLAAAGRNCPEKAIKLYSEPELDFPHQGEGYLKILSLQHLA